MFMCPAVHMSTRNLLRSSSTHEPSDPPFRVVSSVRPLSGCIGLVRSSSRLGARRATAGEVTPDRALSHAGNRVIVQCAARFGGETAGRDRRPAASCRASSVSSFDQIWLQRPSRRAGSSDGHQPSLNTQLAGRSCRWRARRAPAPRRARDSRRSTCHSRVFLSVLFLFFRQCR